MLTVPVIIAGKDRKVGAMAKALAVEVAGFEAVGGMTKEYLEEHGSYDFAVRTQAQADELRAAVARYLPGVLAAAL